MTVMQKLGIADEIKAKMVSPPLGVRVSTLVAKGEAEIGVQQIGELLPYPGHHDYIGPLPNELQDRHRLRHGRSANAKEWPAAEALVKEASDVARGRLDSQEDRPRPGIDRNTAGPARFPSPALAGERLPSMEAKPSEGG